MWFIQKFADTLRGHHTTIIRPICTYVFTMDKAYLRHSKNGEQFDISFYYTDQELKVDRRFNFSRNNSEPVNTFLTRVCSNLEKAISKKKKKKKNDDSTEEEQKLFEASLVTNHEIIDEETLCEKVFKEGSNVILRLNGHDYKIIINSPYVDALALPHSMLANFPVYPSKFETVYTNKKHCEFMWYVSKDRKDWTEAGTGFLFTPKNSDIDSYVKLSCLPRNSSTEGPLTEAVSEVTIDASPGFCPFENRHSFTTKRCQYDEFRVVSYNILADLYCDSEFTRTVLHPYCPPYALNMDYRKQLIIKELLGYNSDIICLQEVDKKVYNYDLQPVLAMIDYESKFSLKGGQVAEGLACFYNKHRFELLESHAIVLAEVIGMDPIFSDIYQKISENEQLKERVLNRTTAVQVLVLKSIVTGNLLLVANTHLYFHPDADHIRLMQGALCMRYIEDTHNKLLERYQDDKISIIFCGDFNSVPECGIYQLYTTGYVPGNYKDFESNKDEIIIGLELKQPFKFGSACGTPKFTNFTAGFQDCLDYIFYDTTKLSVERAVPLPTLEELTENTALPSIVFPSDHISLVADLKFI